MLFKKAKKNKPQIRQGGTLFEYRIFRILRKGLGWIGAQGLKLYWATLRMRFEEGAKEAIENTSEPTVVLIWHNNLLISSAYYKMRRGRKLHAAISAGAIGAWISDLFENLEMGVIRGSVNWRGKQALKEMVQVMENGNDVVITPDGSRGPVYKMKPGAALLAKRTNCRILMISHECSAAFRCPSWDKFIIPMPFSKVKVKARLYQNIAEITESDKASDIIVALEKELVQLTVDELIR